VFLIIDGNNLAWAGYYALERAMKPADDDRRARVAMLGLTTTVLGAIARGGDPPDMPATTQITRVAVCFDEGRPLRRRKVFPPYQTGRERDPKFMRNEPINLGAIDEFTRVATTTLPIEILRDRNTEADDLIAGLADCYRGEAIRIVSTDRDFLQLVDATTTVYSPVKKLLVHQSNVFTALGVKPVRGRETPFARRQLVDYRALIGDTSDDVPGVAGVGPTTAAALLGAGPLDDLFGDARMDLRLPSPCWEKLDDVTSRGHWDRPAFESWLKDEKLSRVAEGPMFRQLESLAAHAVPA
jgi:DNA polymerase-1